jgi:hypothetical protein
VSRRAWLIGVVPLLLMQPEGALGRFPLPEIVGMSGRENPKAPVETSHAPLTLLARPTFMLRRGDIRIEVRVLRHADNRRLAIAWTSDVGIDGQDGPVLHVLTLPSQPAANYLFVATVIDRAGKPRGRAQAQIRLAGDDGA